MPDSKLDFKIISRIHSGTNVQAAIIPVGNITAVGLSELLKRIVEEQLIAEAGYSFDSFNIHAYPGVDDYDQGIGGWIGWYYNVPADLTPRLMIRFLDALRNPEERRFELSEEQRRLIFIEVWSAETAAMNEANKRYPTFDVSHPVARETMERHSELENILLEQKMDGIAQGHRLTRDQLKAIGEEALEKNWPGVRNN